MGFFRYLHMADIEKRADVELLVKSFYSKALRDKLIGHFFSEVAKLDLDTHLPTMYDFWESTLFGVSTYQGNPMIKHIALHKKSPMESHHFVQWLTLWRGTVNELFKGPKADEAINRAQQIAHLMEYKVRGRFH